MQTHQRVILFAHPRSGSTSLYQILKLHPQLRILQEPFNPDFVQWSPNHKNYLSYICDIPSLDVQLADIFTTCNGLTLLNYQLPDDLIAHILGREDHLIIFLQRKNLLQAVVSNLIALQTKVWKKQDMIKPLADYYQHLQGLSIAVVKQQVSYYDRHLKFCESIIDQRGAGTYLKLTYEDLYYSPPAVQAEQLAAIWCLLALQPIESEYINYCLSPEKVKINSATTYSWLPNAREINEQCGNDRTGWLYELTQAGGPPAFNEPRKRYYLNVTKTGWEGSQAAIRASGLGYSSVSELLENLGRGRLKLVPLKEESQE